MTGLRARVAYLSFLIGAIGVTTFFTIGAWQRRWIADDGLIVLRTVRNLLAGNGPVFNAGERVEANTSTAWTYIVWFFAWITGGQLEYVALWTALIMSVIAVPLAMYGTARLLWPTVAANRGVTLLLPLGSIIYITLPPARDFATSGLENGLSIFWVAALWCLFLAWAKRDPTTSHRERAATLFLAFVAGLAPLIRPELTLLGALVLLVLVCAPNTSTREDLVGRWGMRVAIVVVAGILPIAYQVFRMGYYAVLVPNPAIAKDASGSKWGQGFKYLANMFGPYVLLLPVILALVAVAWLLYSRRTGLVGGPEGVSLGASGGRHSKSAQDPTEARSIKDRVHAFFAGLRAPRTVVAVVVAAGLILALYWLRQGGDFMHARVLLTPLFILLLPIMVIPVAIPADVRLAWRTPHGALGEVVRRKTRISLVGAVLLGAIWITTVSWAATVNQNTLPGEGLDIGRTGIVDERRFYAVNMGNPNPVTAQDYLQFPRMHAMMDAIDTFRDEGAVLIAAPDYDGWYYARLPANIPADKRQVTVYFLNLGMTSMLAPLDVRVVDQMGLAYPIAAHTDRLQDGRIGHDKILPTEWVVAESGAFPRYPVLPLFLDQEVVRQAQVALTCPDTMDRIASYKAQPWSFQRFRSSLRQSFGFTKYRMSRIPEYEIQRCGLPMPPRIRPE